MYRKNEHYHIVDQYLCGLYEYIHTHKSKIDIIKKVFGPLSHEIFVLLGYCKDIRLEFNNNNYRNNVNINNNHLTPQLSYDISTTNEDSIGGGYYTSATTQRSYIDSLPQINSNFIDRSQEQYYYINILPSPKDIHDTLEQHGYPIGDRNGYNHDFIGYKKIVKKVQQKKDNISTSCKFELFPQEKEKKEDDDNDKFID